MTVEERAALLQKIMKEKDMTCARLQRKVGLNIKTVYNVVNGDSEKTPDLKTLTLIAEGLEIDPAKLV